MPGSGGLSTLSGSLPPTADFGTDAPDSLSVISGAHSVRSSLVEAGHYVSCSPQALGHQRQVSRRGVSSRRLRRFALNQLSETQNVLAVYVVARIVLAQPSGQASGEVQSTSVCEPVHRRAEYCRANLNA